MPVVRDPHCRRPDTSAIGECSDGPERRGPLWSSSKAGVSGLSIPTRLPCDSPRAQVSTPEPRLLDWLERNGATETAPVATLRKWLRVATSSAHSMLARVTVTLTDRSWTAMGLWHRSGRSPPIGFSRRCSFEVGGRVVAFAPGRGLHTFTPQTRDVASEVCGWEPLEILRRGEPVEERTVTGVSEHRHEDLGELFLDGGVLQGACVERFHADVAAELLDGRSGFFIADPDVVWPGRGGGGLIEQVAEIQVERLGGGTARLGFDVLGDRGVPGRRRVLDDAHSIRRIEDDLAVQAANARQASGTASLGTASSTTSASAASPPSRPSSITSCPAAVHSRASVPPIVPLPIVVIFMVLSFCSEWLWLS